MNTHDADIIAGIVIGASITGMLASGLWLWVCRQAGRPVLPIVDDDTPFRPMTDADLRLIRVCETCRKHIGPTRTVHQGQHLSIIGTRCARCSKLEVKP